MQCNPNSSIPIIELQFYSQLQIEIVQKEPIRELNKNCRLFAQIS